MLAFCVRQCVMEVFIFMRIKDVGARSAQLASQFITVKLLGDSTVLVLSLAHFDAAKSQCRYDRDRQKLLAVIEASFGTTAPFNQLVLEVLNARALGLKEASHSAKTVKGRSGRGASTDTDVVVV